MDLPVAELAKSFEPDVDGPKVLATSATAGKNSSAARLNPQSPRLRAAFPAGRRIVCPYLFGGFAACCADRRCVACHRHSGQIRVGCAGGTSFERLPPPHRCNTSCLPGRGGSFPFWDRLKVALTGDRDLYLTRRMILAGGVATIAAPLLTRPVFAADDTIKIGILHSLSGTMAIPETTLNDTMLRLIDAQNAKGGVLAKKLAAAVVDPASDWPLFAEKARALLTVDKVAVMFGCWTSVSRKSVLPVIEKLTDRRRR